VLLFRSAGFQPLYRRASRLQTLKRKYALKGYKICRLEIGDTAGWKPALRPTTRECTRITTAGATSRGVFALRTRVIQRFQWPNLIRCSQFSR
jgi:hypothetical protein